MFLRIVLIVSIATLGVALLATSSEDYRVLMQFLVCASAVLMLVHAMRGRPEYFWAGTFCVIAVLFNPVFPLTLPGRVFILLDLVSMVLFFAYYSSYKSKPLLAMPSVVDRTSGQHWFQRSRSRLLMLVYRR